MGERNIRLINEVAGHADIKSIQSSYGLTPEELSTFITNNYEKIILKVLKQDNKYGVSARNALIIAIANNSTRATLKFVYGIEKKHLEEFTEKYEEEILWERLKKK